MMASTYALVVQNIASAYQDKTILEDIDLSLEKGEILCLIGASGCGKTTLLKVIAGLQPITKGGIFLGAKQVSSPNEQVPPELRNMGLIFQDYALFPHMTVAQNIGFGLTHLEKAAQARQIQKMLNLVHLEEFAYKYPHQLSGGQQQRVAIARSLAYEPELILLDEPFSNIDSQVRQKLIMEIRKIFKSQGVSAIFVTHNKEEAFAFSDKVALMNQGRIEQFGLAQDLYHAPKTKFVANFLGEANYISATYIGEQAFLSPFGEFGAICTNISHQELMPNHAYQALIRPSQLALSLDEEGQGQIIERTFMGDIFHYLIEYQGKVLKVYHDQCLALDEKVRLSLTTSRVVIFN